MCLMLQPTFNRPRPALAVRRYRAHTGERRWSRGENLLPVDIVPDANMAGVVGDVVKSAKAGSTIKHFVTPLSDEVGPFPLGSEPHVMLKAGELTEAEFNQSYEWEGGEPATPNNKRKVLRTATGTGPTEVKIKMKNSGTIAAQMDVWVVWTILELDSPQQGHKFNQGTVDTPNPPGLHGPGASISADWFFAAQIEPGTIITAPERPDFSGSPKSDVPNRNALNANDGQEFGQPKGKWDISRQVRIRILSPQISKKDMGYIPGTLFDNLPNANITPPTTPAPGPDSYPLNKLEGNDDSPGNEDTNPYPEGDSPEAPGYLTDHDNPVLPVVIDQTVAVGSEIEVRAHYREFCRLEIGGKWFPISELKPWRLHGILKKTWIAAEDDADGDGAPSTTNGKIEGKMRNHGSITDKTNQGW